MNLIRRSDLAIALLVSSMALPAVADTFTIRMISEDPNIEGDSTMVFDPPLLRVALGDTVIFEPVQSGHNTASKNGMIPEGVESWNSRIDETFEITFSVDGTYGYVCMPHYLVGMVGMILVGDYSVNLDDARAVRHRGHAKKAFKALFALVDAL
ncbi:MAG: pseudoazurin [Rhodobacteraceae bacterium]|nr:pseudoazurin [Paracoccaceae bacterium]